MGGKQRLELQDTRGRAEGQKRVAMTFELRAEQKVDSSQATSNSIQFKRAHSRRLTLATYIGLHGAARVEADVELR